MRYDCIHRRREQYSVRMMCRLLRVSRSGYYDWRHRGESARQRRDQQLMPLVRQDPGDTEVQRLLGAVLRAEGRTDEARRAFLRAGSAEPRWFDDWVN